MLKNSTIFITGGTGSFGKEFVENTLKRYTPKKIIIYSRDEMKQWEMAQKYCDDPRIKFVIGDVRDKDRLKYSIENSDFVVHAAATKIVPTAEYNPIECIKTNIEGASNIIEASIEKKVKKVVSLSTDKASNPINLYGATKLASDKLFIAACLSPRENKPLFSVVRYGNVIASRGSVIPFFIKQAEEKKYFTITDLKMTRFMITLKDAVQLVWHAFEDMQGSEIYVKKIPSMTISDISNAVNPNIEKKIIGIRPGEKIHEQMIGFEDAPFTYSYNGYFKILPMIDDLFKDPARIKNGKLVSPDFIYRSDLNNQWMKSEELRKILIDKGLLN